MSSTAKCPVDEVAVHVIVTGQEAVVKRVVNTVRSHYNNIINSIKHMNGFHHSILVWHILKSPIEYVWSFASNKFSAVSTLRQGHGIY